MRILILVLSFYLTLAIIQIPFVQSLIPGYVKQLLAPAPEYTEYNYVSVVLPKEDFDPSPERYAEGLLPMTREDVEQALANIPGMAMVEDDYYNYIGKTITVDVFLYTGRSKNQIIEIELDIPLNRPDAAEELADVLMTIASALPGTQIFDYNNRRLYKMDEKDELIYNLQQGASPKGQAL